MPLQSPQDLFVYQLSGMNSAEQIKLNMLPQLEQACQNPQVKQYFGNEIPETQQQISRLQECFRLMGVQPMNVTSHATQCVQQDVQQFMQQSPNPQAIDLFALETATAVNHVEISSYTGLVEMARMMGQTQVVSLLEDNLRDEQSSARQAEQLGRQIGSQVVQRMRP